MIDILVEQCYYLHKYGVFWNAFISSMKCSFWKEEESIYHAELSLKMKIRMPSGYARLSFYKQCLESRQPEIARECAMLCKMLREIIEKEPVRPENARLKTNKQEFDQPSR